MRCLIYLNLMMISSKSKTIRKSMLMRHEGDKQFTVIQSYTPCCLVQERYLLSSPGPKPSRPGADTKMLLPLSESPETLLEKDRNLADPSLA